MLNKASLLSLIRQSGLSRVADMARYRLMQWKNRSKNDQYVKAHPDIALPPPYMVYESFQIDYQKYFDGGREDAEWILSLVQPHLICKGIHVLDWGCGPGRIIRHMPSLAGPTNEYYGTDYNVNSLSWCKVNLQGISFSKNELSPPLPYTDQQFGLIYGISILTHLSAAHQSFWCRELSRILSPDGILLLTTHGDAFTEKLTPAEKADYAQGKLITRDKTQEGHRTYGTFHPPAQMVKLFNESGLEVIEHIPGRRVHESYIAQDTWLLRRKK